MTTVHSEQDVAIYKDRGLWVRNKADSGVIDQQKDYQTLVPLNIPKPKILDLGGYIGTFAWFAMNNLDPTWVISVEPDPMNIEMFLNNWSGHKQVTLLQGAVTDKDGDIMPLYLGKTYRSCNSLEHFRGRESINVGTIAFKTLLGHQPDIIKCDIEGGEFGITWSDLPKSVKAIAMEIHQQRPQWIDQMKLIDQQILDQGFVHVKKPKHVQTFHKVDIAVYSRTT